MRKILLVAATLFLTFQSGPFLAIYGQTNSDKITSEEIAAANELSDRFIRRLDETGDIEPLIKEMFVGDFMLRYVKEKKNLIQAGNKHGALLFSPGIEFDPSLLDTASENEWKRLYFQNFNYIYYGFATMQNAVAKSILSGKGPDMDFVIGIAKEMNPPGVIKLYAADPILRDYFEKTGPRRPIKTIDELRRVIKILNQGAQILHADKRWSRMKLTPDSKKALEFTRDQMGDALKPYVEITEREEYGFKKGTRIVYVRSSAAFQLSIIKIGGEYKILAAEPYMGD